MFEDFYRLKRNPFGPAPDPAFLYMSEGHEEVLARLGGGVQRGQHALVTGEAGCGKTTITRALIDSLGDSYEPVLILNPALSPLQFLRTVARRVGADAGVGRRDELIDSVWERLYGLSESNLTPVIIIDEAHLVPTETFEEIRLLLNLQLDDRNLFVIVLAGQSALGPRMMQRELFGLRQRIGVFCIVSPLSEESTRNYIVHRLRVGGREEPLFTDDAIDLVYRYSGGLPRMINSVAMAALLSGAKAEVPVIDRPRVRDAAREMMLAAEVPEGSPGHMCVG